ncbi:MAG: HAMP domain-containing sensor histidine kinase [Patescibacteria group bacterium]
MQTLINGKDNRFIEKIILGILYLPVVLFVPTSLMLYAFDESICLSLEGPMATYYTYGIEGIILVWIVIFAIRSAIRLPKRRGEITILTLGITSLLLMFSLGNIISSFNEDWRFAQIGLFTMPVFISFFVYSIVKYKTFNIRLFSTVALVMFIGSLIASLLFVDDTNSFRIITAAAFILFIILGYLLIRSVYREIKQREEIEKLAYGLERANERLQILDKQKSEFVSIASHQLRSPLTAIRGYVSMMAEGSFGQLPEKAQEILERVNESSKFMATSINDFLDVSRIESGNMKYEYMDVNLKDQAEHVVDDLRADAVKRGLMLLYRSDMQGTGLVRADAGKTQQIFHNLINNALKYTPKGSVTVYAHDDVKSKKIYVDIIDTGVGLSSESMQKLFGKFARAKIASSANIMGTGLGLFVAREMARAMGGDITVQSEGEGKGSTFTISFPLV